MKELEIQTTSFSEANSDENEQMKKSLEGTATEVMFETMHDIEQGQNQKSGDMEQKSEDVRTTLKSKETPTLVPVMKPVVPTEAPRTFYEFEKHSNELHGVNFYQYFKVCHN